MSTQRTPNERLKRPLHDKDRVIAARIKARLIQAEVRRRAGLATGTLSRIEAGTVGTTPETLGKIAKAIGCDYEDLLFQPTAEPKPEATP